MSIQFFGQKECAPSSHEDRTSRTVSLDTMSTVLVVARKLFTLSGMASGANWQSMVVSFLIRGSFLSTADDGAFGSEITCNRCKSAVFPAVAKGKNVFVEEETQEPSCMAVPGWQLEDLNDSTGSSAEAQEAFRLAREKGKSSSRVACRIAPGHGCWHKEKTDEDSVHLCGWRHY